MNADEKRAVEWECTRLINLYALLNDEARWEEVAALYTEDGLMTRPTAPDKPVIGRQALLEAFLSRPPRVSRHVCSNIVVSVESEREASAQSVILLFLGTAADDARPPQRDASGPLVGTYEDRFKLTKEGWRFSERRGALSFRP